MAPETTYDNPEMPDSRALRRWLATTERPVTVILGTRAQAIKMAPVLRSLEAHGHAFQLVLTGQHQITIPEIIADFEIETKPIELFPVTEISGIWKMLLWLPQVVFRLFRLRGRILRDRSGKPHLVLVHGDTVSTLAGAIAGRLAGCPIAHIEAGLRSFKLTAPFPEELTRILVSRFTQLHYAPGAWAAGNLPGRRGLIVDTKENTLIDSLRHALASRVLIPDPKPVTPYCVVSIHRFENIFSRQRMRWLAKALTWIATKVNVEFILHPATEKRLAHYGLRDSIDPLHGIRTRNRMSYIPFVQLLRGATFVITDGGSNQEELHYLGKPTLVLRDTTERQEGIGYLALLCSFDYNALRSFVSQSLSGNIKRSRISKVPSPSESIVEHIRNVGHKR